MSKRYRVNLRDEMGMLANREVDSLSNKSDARKRDMIEAGMNVVAGLDIVDKHSHVCLIDLDGRILESQKNRTSLPAMQKYFGAGVVQNVSDDIRRYDKCIEQLCEHGPATRRRRSKCCRLGAGATIGVAGTL